MDQLFSAQPKIDSNEAAFKRLMNHQKAGNLFHGSPNNSIEELIPRPARDTNPKFHFNTDTAVFATDSAASGVIFGLVDRALMPEDTKRSTWGVDWNNGVIARIPASWRPIIEHFKGTVYVLSPETFTERNYAQFKSRVAVKPIERLTVTLSDFYELGGIVEWVST